jgi:recombination protein RecA
MRVALSKTTFESEIVSRFGAAFTQQKSRVEVMSTGITEVDSIIGGLPRGAITEIFGPPSSGRTSFMLSILAQAATNKEVCALIDTSDVFDPISAAAMRLDLDQLLWIRCAANIEHAFKATDLLLQGGGFGLVLLDLGDIAGKDVRRIISSWWYRFRRTVENTPTALVVIATDSCVRSCASLALELSKDKDIWSSHRQRLPISFNSSVFPELPQQPTHANLLTGMKVQLDRHRPLHAGERTAHFKARANHA